MQQAYQALRVISQTQTIHIVLESHPGELTLRELLAASAGLHTGGDNGVKAVILDFADQSEGYGESAHVASELQAEVEQVVAAIPQPVLAIARVSLSVIAMRLMEKADFTLIAYEASLPQRRGTDTQDNEGERIGGLAAARLGFATWTANCENLDQELEHILSMLRSKSASALRHAKASVRLANVRVDGPLETLHQVNQLYLETVMQTEDAREGLQAFLEKRQPRWKNC